MIAELKIKRQMYNELKEIYLKLFIMECITTGLTRIINYMPQGITVLVSLANLGVMIAMFVFWIQYITKAKSIGKYFENKKLVNSINLVVWGYIGLLVFSFVGCSAIAIFYVQLLLSSGLDVTNPNLDAFVSYFMNSGALYQILGGAIVLGLLILVCLILTYVGSYKEFTGHMIEMDSVDEEAVQAFKKAQKMYLIFIIAGLVVSGIVMAGVDGSIRTIAYVAGIATAIVPLYFKKVALDTAVAALDVAIEVKEREAAEAVPVAPVSVPESVEADTVNTEPETTESDGTEV